MICSPTGHIWIWGSSSTAAAAVPVGLRCKCGAYTREMWFSLEHERDRLQGENVALRAALADIRQTAEYADFWPAQTCREIVEMCNEALSDATGVVSEKTD